LKPKLGSAPFEKLPRDARGVRAVVLAWQSLVTCLRLAWPVYLGVERYFQTNEFVMGVRLDRFAEADGESVGRESGCTFAWIAIGSADGRLSGAAVAEDPGLETRAARRPMLRRRQRGADFFPLAHVVLFGGVSACRIADPARKPSGNI